MSVSQLSRLLPLPDEDLQQVLTYAATLSKTEAVEHFRNLLGDSPDAVDFISSFNSRRQDPKATPAPQPSSSSSQPQAQSNSDGVPKPSRNNNKKKKAPLHTPAPRQVTNLGPAPGTAYNKRNNLDDDYRSGSSSRAASPAKPPAKAAAPAPPKPPPSAAGHLISDLPSKSKPKSNPVSRSTTPAPKTKVNISGGTAMHGASSALSDLDAAIRALELTTNPTKSSDASRKCNCVAARHPLLAAAPNCLHCGKVICVKEGLGPCTSCGNPLLTSDEVQSMIKELKAERGREKQAVDRDAHRRADVSRTPAPFTKPRENNEDASSAEVKAREHRDRLLAFQNQNARRTTVRDEAADFDVTGAMAGTGGSMWSSPEERARELKRQQKVLREMEWNAKPEYEKRRQVVSIDLVGGKVVRKMAAMERPASPVEEDVVEVVEDMPESNYVTRSLGGGGGAFSKNPLLAGLIRPVFEPEGKGKGAELEGRKDRKTKWRRVQDNMDDNSDVILNGGAYGNQPGTGHAVTAGGDEPDCG
ncbi:C2HC5 finger protein [Apiospora arundinis]|uniref:C2HC5 finger protein n=1 Tax=Apiospora arundinis TaxID=335852 RepID=A0ABR2ISV6_9PEZI